MRSLFHTIMGKGGVNPLWSDLIGYYTSDNTPNTSIGSVNGALVNGATYATGKINNAFSFDGVNDYVDLDDNYNFTFATPFSISIWFYPNSLASYQTLFGKQSLTAPEYKGYQLQTDGANIRFAMYSNWTASNYMQKRRSLTLTNGAWNHLVVTYDGSKNTSGLKIYINGSDGAYDVDYNNLTSNIDNTGVKATISSANNQGWHANGKIDETAIWSCELTSAQVTELYNSGNGLQYI